MKDKRVIAFILLFLLAGTMVGYAAIPQNTFRQNAGLTTPTVNATVEYYRGPLNYTTWILAKANTGIPRHDQDLNTTDNVGFASVNATDEFYRAGTNYTAQIEALILAGILPGNFTLAYEDMGAPAGPRTALNFREGPNITIALVDDVANDQINITITAAGGGGGRIAPDYLIFLEAGVYHALAQNGSIMFSNANYETVANGALDDLTTGGWVHNTKFFATLTNPVVIANPSIRFTGSTPRGEFYPSTYGTTLYNPNGDTIQITPVGYAGWSFRGPEISHMGLRGDSGSGHGISSAGVTDLNRYLEKTYIHDMTFMDFDNDDMNAIFIKNAESTTIERCLFDGLPNSSDLTFPEGALVRLTSSDYNMGHNTLEDLWFTLDGDQSNGWCIILNSGTDEGQGASYKGMHSTWMNRVVCYSDTDRSGANNGILVMSQGATLDNTQITHSRFERTKLEFRGNGTFPQYIDTAVLDTNVWISGGCINYDFIHINEFVRNIMVDKHNMYSGNNTNNGVWDDGPANYPTRIYDGSFDGFWNATIVNNTGNARGRDNRGIDFP